ncbi:MAG: nuclear transport factor 2 family protein [Gammaproteobacteria bacterium]|nr:nuclear transport factor 2 family protein [Gammaproteobacteria bacterium]
MPEQSNRQRVAQFITAFEQGQVELQRSLVHPEVVFHSPESLPYGGEWHGLDGWQRMKQAIAVVWSELDLKIRRVVGAEDDDCFVIIADLKARSRQTGQVYAAEVMEKWLWRDGLLVLVRPYYWDTARVNQVIGAA